MDGAAATVRRRQDRADETHGATRLSRNGQHATDTDCAGAGGSRRLASDLPEEPERLALPGVKGIQLRLMRATGARADIQPPEDHRRDLDQDRQPDARDERPARLESQVFRDAGDARHGHDPGAEELEVLAPAGAPEEQAAERVADGTGHAGTSAVE